MLQLLNSHCCQATPRTCYYNGNRPSPRPTLSPPCIMYTSPCGSRIRIGPTYPPACRTRRLRGRFILVTVPSTTEMPNLGGVVFIFWNGKKTTLSWLISFLSNRLQRVIINGHFSSFTSVLSGVPQGTVLGPLLFLIFINDLPSYIFSSTIRLFADDCLIYKEIRSPNDSVALQSDLNSLQTWCDHWLLKFNVSKCSFISITNKKKPLLFQYTLSNSPLLRVSKFQYLGITFDNKLSWSDHISYICFKAKRTIYFLNRNLQGASPDRKLQAYVTYVRPIIEYASCVWNPSSVDSTKLLDSVQRLAIRFIRNNFSRRYSFTLLSNGIDLDSLSFRRNLTDLTMVFKILRNEIFLSKDEFFSSFSSRKVTRGHNSKLFKPQCSVNSFRDSFSFRIIDP